MIRGKFFATDDLDMAFNRIRNWAHIEDLPVRGSSEGMVIANVGGKAQWTFISEGLPIAVSWDIITDKPAEFAPTAHTHPWTDLTDVPALVTTVTGGDGITVESTGTSGVVVTDAYHVDTFEPGGFIAEPGSFDSTVAITDNRTFTIEPTGTSYSFYCQGTKYTKTATETVTFPDSEGIHFFYFDSDGLLTTTQTIPEEAIFKTGAFVAVARWDTSAGSVIYFGEERHGCRMDGRTHWYLHESFGTQYLSGHALGNITSDGAGSSDAHATLSVAGGLVADEDLFQQAAATASTYTDWYVYSKTDTGDWQRTATGSVPIRQTANNTPTYNLVTGATWSQSQIGNTDLVLAHIFRTNSTTRPYISVQGENVYGNVASARAGAATEIADLYQQGMPFIEFVPLGTIIYQYGSAYSNSFNVRIRTTDDGQDYVDWRTAEIQPSGAGPSDHGSLAGLADADHPLSALQQSGATSGQVPVWNGTNAAWEPGTISGGGGTFTGSVLSITSISHTGDPDTRIEFGTDVIALEVGGTTMLQLNPNSATWTAWFGVSTSTRLYMSATGQLDVPNRIYIGSTIHAPGRIEHRGDADTAMAFTDNHIALEAGGTTHVTMNSTSLSVLTRADFSGVVTVGSWFDVTGSLSYNNGIIHPVVGKAANYTLTTADYLVYATATADIFLPTASSHTGREFIIKRRTAGGTVRVRRTGTDVIDSVTSITLPSNFDFLRVISRGAEWCVVGKNF